MPCYRWKHVLMWILVPRYSFIICPFFICCRSSLDLLILLKWIICLALLVVKENLFMLQWTFHPFILQTKRFYTVLIWRRVLAFLCVSVSLLGTLLYVIIWCLLQFVTYTIVSLFLCVFFLQASQFLRIVTFYSTQLPGPNYHCREVRFY
jgi:hypothetical protein